MELKEKKNNLLSQIDELVVEYYKTVHSSKKKEFSPGSRIPYAGRVFDEKELIELVHSGLEFWLTNGNYTERFEKGLADFLEVPFCSFVNSGSSANLLAFMALTSPLLGERAISRGDEVITVACGFPTTVSPIVQYGAVPVFVDVTIPEYNVDVRELEKALSPKTKAVILAHTLGNPFDLQKVKDFCEQNKLWLIEDNCDALGSEFKIDGKWVKTGSVGDIGTSSFYPAHHITTGEGGAVYTKNHLLHKIIHSIRDWGRDCVCASGQDNRCGHRFDGQFGSLPLGYDHKYVYSHFGYNLKATDMQAAIGCVQLERLPFFTQKRRENYQTIYNGLKHLQEYIELPVSCENANPSWFGLLIMCKQEGARTPIVKHLEENGIQTRMLFGGNLLRHPCMEHIKAMGGSYRSIGGLEQTDRVLNSAFWVGVYPGLSKEEIDYMIQSIERAVTDERISI